MAANEIHVSDKGTRFVMTFEDDGVAVDLTTATTLELCFKSAALTYVIKTGAKLTPPGVDGKIYWDATAAFLTPKGKWQIQGHITRPDGEWWSDISTFYVYPNLA